MAPSLATSASFLDPHLPALRNAAAGEVLRTTPAAMALRTPNLRVVQISGRRRRTYVPTPPPSATCGTITNYYPNRVYTPHVAANPANYTPDHDPDKQ